MSWSSTTVRRAFLAAARVPFHNAIGSSTVSDELASSLPCCSPCTCGCSLTLVASVESTPGNFSALVAAPLCQMSSHHHSLAAPPVHVAAPPALVAAVESKPGYSSTTDPE